MTRVIVLVGLVVSLLVAAGPDAAAVPTGTPVSSPSDVGAWAQATDRQGDTAFVFASGPGGLGTIGFRIRRADGSLGPAVDAVTGITGFTTLLVAVDADGDGALVWDDARPGDQTGWVVRARRFTRSGALGPVVDLAPPDHAAYGPTLVVRPDGTAVVAWSRDSGDPQVGFVPYLRTLDTDSRLGPVLQPGPGPNGLYQLAAERDGDVVLVFSEQRAIKTRRLTPEGRLTTKRTVYRWTSFDEKGRLEGLAVDRRGVATLVFTRWRPLPPTPIPPPGGSTYERGAVLRIAPDGRPAGRPQWFMPDGADYDGLRLGVAPDGTAVVGWQQNYYQGAWVRRLSSGGVLGPAHRIASAGLHDIVLRRNGDGFVTGSGRGPDGLHRAVRVAKVVDGHVRPSRKVAVAETEAHLVHGALLPGGGWLAGWLAGISPGQVRVITGR